MALASASEDIRSVLSTSPSWASSLLTLSHFVTQVVHRPSISKNDGSTLLEPKPRESLLVGNRDGSRDRRPSISSSVKTTDSASALAQEKKEREEKEMVARANEAVMERQRFAIDDVGDDEDDGEEGGEEDDGVMDEVRLLVLFSFSSVEWTDEDLFWAHRWRLSFVPTEPTTLVCRERRLRKRRVRRVLPSLSSPSLTLASLLVHSSSHRQTDGWLLGLSSLQKRSLFLVDLAAFLLASVFHAALSPHFATIPFRRCTYCSFDNVRRTCRSLLFARKIDSSG
jgi:hypothetical protein